MFTTDYRLSVARCVRSRTMTSRRGFTLIELLVSMFMFVILMAAISQIFTAAFAGYRNTKSVQQDLEAAQFAVNTIAKELRTSTVESASGSQSSVLFYDYSQKTCFRYSVSGANLRVERGSSSDENRCSVGLSGPAIIASGIIGGKFFVTPSERLSGTPPTGTVGKVTISLEIGEGVAQGLAHRARIQTSVSLRDYSYVGLLDTDPAP